MRRPCTPGEAQRMLVFLDPLPPERRGPVARMIFEAVADCPACDEVVRRCDRRVLVAAELHHLGCVEASR